MGNRVGIDISGALVRVSCICFPRDPDEYISTIAATSGICQPSPQIIEMCEREYWSGSNDGYDVNHEAPQRSLVINKPCTSSEQKTKLNSSCGNNKNTLLLSSKSDLPNSITASKYSLNPSINGNAPFISSNGKSEEDVVCPYRLLLHNYSAPEELAIRSYLDSAPLLSSPRTFCFSLYGPRPGKAFCFVIDVNKIEDAIREALPYLQNSHLQLTGSGASYFRDILSQKFPHVGLHLQFHREISCILEALDFLICQVPGACFRYARTHRALNSVLPDDKNYTAVPLTKEDRDLLYPFLLVNLKAGVSFHMVTAPNESERIGGSTIGGATFMGLIRLLCRSITSPLDAFLLAQSGDNSTTDMLVGDIYGGDYPAIGLKATTVASTFGKLQSSCPETLKPISGWQRKWLTQGDRYGKTKMNNLGPPQSRTAPHSRTPSVDSAEVDSSKSINDSNRFDIFIDPALEQQQCSPESVQEFCKGSSLSYSSLEMGSKTSFLGTTSLLGKPCHLPSTSRPSDSPSGTSTELRQPISSNVQEQFGMGSQNVVASETPPSVMDCGNPLCCCCGLQRWAQGEKSEEEAVAAAGIISDTSEMYCSLQGGELIESPCNLASFQCPDFTKSCGIPIDSPDRSSAMERRTREPTEADVARSILIMMSFNVAQQAYLNSVLYNCSRIVLVGYYLEMPGYLASIQHCIDFWSGGKCKINFVRLSTNLGALGASLRTRRRASGAYLLDCISDDKNPSPHRTIYHLQEAFGNEGPSVIDFDSSRKRTI